MVKRSFVRIGGLALATNKLICLMRAYKAVANSDGLEYHHAGWLGHNRPCDRERTGSTRCTGFDGRYLKEDKITTRIPTNVQNNTLGQHSHTLKKKLECFAILHKLLWEQSKEGRGKISDFKIDMPNLNCSSEPV